MRLRIGQDCYAVCVLVIVGVGGCVGSSPSWPDAPLVLISIDTLRADRLPVYGYDEIATPSIDKLARDGVVFESAFSHVPLTLPSHLSIFTGLLPHRHGVRANVGYAFDPGSQPFLPKLLKRAGYDTGAAISAYPLSRSAGFGAGFDFFDDADDFSTVKRSRPGGATLERLLPWLRGRAEGPTPFFLFFHLFEPHQPYDPPTVFTSPGRSPYDAEVAASDHLVGGLLNELMRLGLYDRSIVVLLSDHGEGLGDHGEIEHGMLLYREVLQVPLIVKLPNNVGASRRIAAPVGLTDVLPTLSDLLGLEMPTSLDGRSQAGLMFGEAGDPAPRTLFAETLYPRLEMGWSELFSAMGSNHHLIVGPQPELYDWGSDPRETRNLLSQDAQVGGSGKPGEPSGSGEPAADSRRVLGELRQDLDRLGAAFVPAGEVSEESSAALASLGYVGSSGGREDPSVSPRDRIQVYETYRSGQRAFTRGDWQQAEVFLRKTLEQDPEVIDAWLLLGSALDRMGRPGEALEDYLRGGPVSDRALEIAGEVLGLCRNLNRLYLCADHLAIFADAQPTVPQIRYLQAQTLRELGRYDEALEVAEVALQIAPADPDAHSLRGAVLAGLERFEEAREDLQRAVDMTGEQHLPAMVDLAMVLARLGETQEARRLVELARFAAPDEPSVRAAARALGLE